MKCPKCGREMKEVAVSVEGAKQKVKSHQCSCDYFEFEPQSSAEVIKELKAKESPLVIEQKIIKLSGARLGIYFNKNIIKSLKLRSGETVRLSVPDRKHILLNL